MKCARPLINQKLKVRIRSLLVPKSADLVNTGYFGRLLEDHFRRNQYFSKRFSDSCSVFQYGCATCLGFEILIFSLTRGVGLFQPPPPPSPVVFRLQNPFQVSQGFYWPSKPPQHVVM